VNHSNGLLWSVLALLCCAGPLCAQAGAATEDEDGPDWYRVELLLFANRDIEAAHSESWSLLPSLNYPQTLQRIQQRPHRRSADAKSELVEFDQLLPEPAFSLAWQTPVEQLLLDYRRSQLWQQPTIHMEPLFDLDVPVPFARLPSSESEFVSQRKRLNRSGSIEVLLHESWLQPMRDREDSIPLQIDSSLVAGDFPELQGSILLYSARYLHLETNLWLNTNGSYLDDASIMPLPPLPPVPGAANAMKFFEIAPSPQWLAVPRDTEPPAQEEVPSMLDDELYMLDEELYMLDEEPVVPTAEAELAAAEQDLESMPTDTETEAQSSPAWSEEMLQAWLAKPEYGYRHAVLLEQRRRLRSGELHYIDHPLLGLLIRVSRYEFEPFVDSDAQLNSAAADRP
jgi:hypothetical protein